MPSAAAALDFGAFSQAEKTAMLTAAKSEYLARITGVVTNGSSSGQQFGMQKMDIESLTRLINALTVELGFQQPEIRVAPNFSGRPSVCYPPVAEESDSRIEPDVHSWDDLAALSTTGMPYGTIKIWINSDTGETVTTRLLESTAETNEEAGIRRPDDYADPGNTKVWFQASS